LQQNLQQQFKKAPSNRGLRPQSALAIKSGIKTTQSLKIQKSPIKFASASLFCKIQKSPIKSGIKTWSLINSKKPHQIGD
jgi:hypothetical protein